ncbi:hypothetical protein Taro_031313, partial [Colocasia esculenta]|nr:hypothetical protein [Colocasia esculenta]
CLFCQGNRTRKRPLPRPAVFVEEERTHIIPRASSPLKRIRVTSFGAIKLLLPLPSLICIYYMYTFRALQGPCGSEESGI